MTEISGDFRGFGGVTRDIQVFQTKVKNQKRRNFKISKISRNFKIYEGISVTFTKLKRFQ